MTAKLRNLAIGLVAIATATTTLALTGDANALPPVGSEATAGKCLYAGKEYSEGAVIVVNGRKYECLWDGRWKDIGSGRKGPRGKGLPKLPPIVLPVVR